MKLVSTETARKMRKEYQARHFTSHGLRICSKSSREERLEYFRWYNRWMELCSMYIQGRRIDG